MNDTNVTGRGGGGEGERGGGGGGRAFMEQRAWNRANRRALDYLVMSEWLWEAAFWENSTLGGLGLNCVYTFTSIESMRTVHSAGIRWNC